MAASLFSLTLWGHHSKLWAESKKNRNDVNNSRDRAWGGGTRSKQYKTKKSYNKWRALPICLLGSQSFGSAGDFKNVLPITIQTPFDFHVCQCFPLWTYLISLRDNITPCDKSFGQYIYIYLILRLLPYNIKRVRSVINTCIWTIRFNSRNFRAVARSIFNNTCVSRFWFSIYVRYANYTFDAINARFPFSYSELCPDAFRFLLNK